MAEHTAGRDHATCTGVAREVCLRKTPQGQRRRTEIAVINSQQQDSPLKGAQRKDYIMRALAALTAVVVLAVTANGEEFRIKHRGKVDSAAMDDVGKHISVEQRDYMNYEFGRSMSWGINYDSSADIAASGETMDTTVMSDEPLAAEEVPAWISELKQKGETYQYKKEKKAERNDDRLSAYSQTELSIARYMGLAPWDIDREQLRIWGQEADSVPSTR
jgi:hypothetical protein